jgi:antitoxin (DNA-binding transcriptional repressor) of toxin-antitoxin stability system
MTKPSPWSSARFLSAVLLYAFLSSAGSLAQVSVRSVKVLGAKDAVEIEVEASDRIVPETQVLTGPDRLVVDFPNAIPSSKLRSQSVDRGEVKDVRVGLFQSKPPVTRVVVDLKSARSYQVFPYGRTVMIKVTSSASEVADSADPATTGHSPALVTTNYSGRSSLIRTASPTRPGLEVSYRNGLLAVHSNKANLSEVLYAIQQRTGADISIAAGAEQERVVADIDPAPAPEVIARLLNGSHFNFLILSSPDDPNRLDRVILTARLEGGFAPPPPTPVQNEEGPPETEPVPVIGSNDAAAAPVQPPPPPQPVVEAPDPPQQQ